MELPNLFVLEALTIPIVIFLFALFFYYTGTLKRCLYRRYIFPAMFAILALLYWENFIGFALLLLAAVLTYYGYKGYGRMLLEEKIEKEEEK